ncbi:LysR family transcriptional regulator [Thalassotalea sp. PLHSN55]|uniref:LysR family transcriptional regulator n=1 Tax=Thalassotalea sp. PLHSN55 TaxID=3435888 RepID=UPI003F83B82D
MKKDLNLLRLLIVLNEERQTVLAAKRLHLSQPAISVMLKKLREQFNDPLFVRDKNQLEPTIRCRQLLDAVPPMLDQLDALYINNNDWNIANTQGEVTLLFSPPLMNTLAVPIVQKLSELAPHVTVEAYHWDFDAVRDLELKSNCWGFSYLPMETSNNIFQKDLGNDTFVAVMRKEHPLCSNQLSEMLQYPLCVNVIYGDNNNSRSEKVLKKLQIDKHINVRTSDIGMMLGLVSSSDFIGLVSASNIDRLQQEYRFEVLPEELTNEAILRAFSLFSHQRNRNDPMTQWLFNQAKLAMGLS